MSAAADKLVQVDQVRGRAIVKAKEVLACPGLTELKATALCKAVPAATITNRAAKVDGNGSWGLKPKPYVLYIYIYTYTRYGLYIAI